MMTMETKMENNRTGNQTPAPLVSIQQQQWQRDEVHVQEKNQYWNNILTGDPDTVPDAVRLKAGAVDENCPPEERNYRLMSNINRSWVVDFKDKKKEEVRAAWPDIRLNLAKELGVRDSESEVFAALSLNECTEPSYMIPVAPQ